ncbi:hypothetical protein BGX28_005850 [Mortierella sp. GBA30]|nr:hypothetical protein BGX28_005850 [Mortierella sp. GBA30]
MVLQGASKLVDDGSTSHGRGRSSDAEDDASATAVSVNDVEGEDSSAGTEVNPAEVEVEVDPAEVAIGNARGLSEESLVWTPLGTKRFMATDKAPEGEGAEEEAEAWPEGTMGAENEVTGEGPKRGAPRETKIDGYGPGEGPGEDDATTVA